MFGKTRDGESLIVSTDTLNTATLGVQMSSASQEALAKQGITANQKTFSNINECFEALESGEVDYVICDSTAGGYLARLMSQISYVGTLETPSTLGVAGLGSNDELCRAVSDALDGITVDGTLEAVHCVWYGQMPYDLTAKTVSGPICRRPTPHLTRPSLPTTISPMTVATARRLARRAPSPTMTSTSSIASYW